MFDFDLPEKPENMSEVPGYDDENVIVESKLINGKDHNFVYLKGKYEDSPDYLALCGIINYFTFNFLPPYEVKYTVDDPVVNAAYAEKLIPRAIGYLAGFLDYFFRGKIDIVPDYETGSGYVIKNLSEEDMNGSIELYYDNENDERIKLWEKLIVIKAGSKSENIGDITPPAEDASEYMLVFNGSKLENEDGAIAGKSKVAGNIGLVPDEKGSGYVIENLSGAKMDGTFQLYYDDMNGERTNLWEDVNLSIDAGSKSYIRHYRK